MFILALIVLLLGLTVLFAGLAWFIINAFRESVLWGVMVLIFTPAWIRFAFRHWDQASRPLLVIAAGFLLTYGGGHMMPANAQGAMATAVAPFGRGKVEETKKKPELPAMFAAQKEMELKLKLVALSRKETDLRDRKATIDPKDQLAANALKEEILKYNAELQPVLLEMKERGITAAQ